MIYQIRRELEQGAALLAEAEEALRQGSMGAGKLSKLELLSSQTDAMLILRKQPAYRERFIAALAGIEEYKARQPDQTMPAIADITGDSILLKNLSCIDADGNMFEQYPNLYVRKHVETDSNGNILFFTAYNGEAHLEQKGQRNPSSALYCNILDLLWQNRADAELMAVLKQFKDKGTGYHRANTIIAYAGQNVIHNPYDADFPSYGGNSNINAGRRKALAFSKKRLKSMPLEKALNDAVASRFAKQITGMKNLEPLVEIGTYFGMSAYLGVPNGNATNCNDTRAAGVWCYGCGFVVDVGADDVLSDDGAVRGVSASPKGEP